MLSQLGDLSRSQRPRVDDIKVMVNIDQEHNLHESSADSFPTDQPSLPVGSSGKRSA